LKNKYTIYLALIFTLIICSIALAESWNMNCPATAEIRQKAFANSEYLHLYVPKSFEGRTAKEHREIIGAEFAGVGRFQRTNSRVELHGTVSRFDFNYSQDNLDLQIFKSSKYRPGSNSCMDCHGGRFPRTTAIIGQEHQELLPKPVKKGNLIFTIDPAYTEAFHFGMSHWLKHDLVARFDYKWGYIRQGRFNLKANATTLGLAGIIKHKIDWSGDFIFSKTETFDLKKSFIGKLSYRLGRGFKLGVSGGIFFDGHTRFGTEMSEMGIVSTTLQKDDPDLLPSLFEKLKNDMFGYLHYSVGYEYHF